MNVAAIIIGIDGWEKYTLPLVESIRRHEPDCDIVVVDNASPSPYPYLDPGEYPNTFVLQTERLCYSAAINRGKDVAGDVDWTLVLSNDVLCTGPFIHLLKPLGDVVAGPQLWHEHGLTWLVGWCVAIPRTVWDAVGGWDEAYQVSSWEDVDFSVSAVEQGYSLARLPDFPFKHLEQKQRFTLLPDADYWQSELHNRRYFRRKHG